jgi:glycosyltransferase involved in cell wall biosynthesis
MKNIIFIDFSCDLTHKSVINRPIGASEFMFYITLFNLSKIITNRRFICFNKIENSTIDNIKYTNISEIETFPFRENDIVIIQRLLPNLDLLNKIISKNIYLTQHDYDFNCIFFQYQVGDNKNKILQYINEKTNIKFIFNSEFSKKYIIDNLNRCNMKISENRMTIIPNYIFKEYFEKSDNVLKKEFQLVYASGWNKGIVHIIRIFDYIINQNNNFKLILMSPGYEYKNFEGFKNEIEEKYKNNITILGPINKKDYCKIIQESSCVFAPPFPETFGCVFSESYYLETPVIADIRSGAVVEIIGNENITDYSDLNKTYLKLLEIINRNKHTKTSLNEKYLFNENVWKQKLNL